MIDNRRGAVPATSRELGEAFAASNSPSYGGDLGADFEVKNSIDPDHYDPVHHRIDREAQRKQRRHKWYWLAALVLLAISFVLIHRFTATSDNTKAGGAKGASGSSGAAQGGGGGGGRGAQGPA